LPDLFARSIEEGRRPSSRSGLELPASLLPARDQAAIENGRVIMKRQNDEGKRPGVIALIIESLTHAPKPGLSVAELVELLEKETGRDPAHLTNTVKTQLSRLQRTRGLTIERTRVDGGMRYRVS
jgi:hypothetical protein